MTAEFIQGFLVCLAFAGSAAATFAFGDQLVAKASEKFSQFKSNTKSKNKIGGR